MLTKIFKTVNVYITLHVKYLIMELYARENSIVSSLDAQTQRTHDAIITSSLRQNYVVTSFWRNNGVIVTSFIRWGGTSLNRCHSTEYSFRAFHRQFLFTRRRKIDQLWIKIILSYLVDKAVTVTILCEHYNDVVMGAIASQITSLTIVCSTVYSDADQGKHQSSASLAFARGIHRGPVNSPHKWPVTRKMFPFDDVIMRLLHSPSLVTRGYPEVCTRAHFCYKMVHCNIWHWCIVGLCNRYITRPYCSPADLTT